MTGSRWSDWSRAARLATAAALLASGPVSAQAPAKADGPGVRLSGFVSFSFFGQDRLFGPGNGQNALVVAAVQDGPDGWWHGGDVRNTRLVLDVGVPAVGDWAVGGLVELDLFGGFPSGEAFDREQAYPRLRLAYAEFERGGTLVRLGQDWGPITHDMPESVNQLAFPPGWASAAVIGWRFPGVFLSQQVTALDGIGVTLHAAAMRGDWIGDEAEPERPTAGQATLMPQLQGALELAAEEAAWPWALRIGGHADRKGAPSPEAESPPSGWAVAGSGRLEPGPLTLLAGGYVGHAVGHLGAQVAQLGDIRGRGGWGQAGLALGGGWSVWGFGGVDSPDSEDVGEGEIVQNRTVVLMLQHAAGPYAAGLEWQNVRTDRWGDAARTARDRRHGNQVALGVVVQF